jgi:hypothetical protein
MLRSTVSQPVYFDVKQPSGTQDLRICWCWEPSLTRGWVCRLQLLLVLASAVILGSESHGTHDHILLSEIRDSPNLEGQVPLFICPRNRVAQLYPQALGSLSVASYDSQGYGRSIRTHLHSGRKPNNSESKSELLYDWRFIVNQLVLGPIPRDARPQIFFFETTHLCEQATVERPLLGKRFGQTERPQSFSLATTVVLSPVHTTVTWKWVHMSQFQLRNQDLWIWLPTKQ